MDSPARLRPTRPEDFSEMALAQKASQLGEVFEGRVPSARELENITEELGVELATAIVLKILQDSPVHGEFGRRMRAIDPADPLDRSSLTNEIEVTVVASNHFRSGRKWGDHVDTWRAWARDIGFKTDVIETLPGSSVAENARLIREMLTGGHRTRRIIVTYGQGASEFRYLLHRLRALNGMHELNDVRGWLNICGSFNGSSASRYYDQNVFRRSLEKIRLRLSGRNPSTVSETSSSFLMWRYPTGIPRELITVSLVGLPMRWQISRGLYFLYDQISRRQPNDGVVSFLEATAQPGVIVPISGMSHHAAEMKLRPVFQRTLLLMANSLEIEAKKSPTSEPPGLELDL